MSNKPGNNLEKPQPRLLTFGGQLLVAEAVSWWLAPASGHWPELRSWEFGGWHHRNTRPVETVPQIKYAYQSRTDAYLTVHFYTQFYKEDQQSTQHGVQNQCISTLQSTEVTAPTVFLVSFIIPPVYYRL